MALTTIQISIVGLASRVKIFTASGPTSVFIGADGAGVLIGGADLTLQSGFRLGHTPFITLQLRNNDEVWAIAETDTIITMLVSGQ